VTIWWSDRKSNSDLWKVTDYFPIHIEIRKNKWKWIGFTLRKSGGAIEKDALQLNPQGDRKT
jgi:hypothetical protein